MQAQRKLRSPRPRKSSYPMPSVPLFLPFPNDILEHSRQICTGADVEMITPGGEKVFVNKMVDECTVLGQRCQHVQSSIISYLLVRKPFSQMVYLHGWRAIISHGSRHAPPHSLSRSLNMPLLSWFRATPVAGRSPGPLQMRACQTYVQIQPLLSYQSSHFINIFYSSPGRRAARRRCITSPPSTSNDPSPTS